jgi:hypothetical protein
MTDDSQDDDIRLDVRGRSRGHASVRFSKDRPEHEVWSGCYLREVKIAYLTLGVPDYVFA